MDLERLATKIKRNIVNNFTDTHLSGNLMETIKVNPTSNGGFEVIIPAEMYDLKEYYKNGAIIYTHKGSYAQQVNEYGGFSGTHKSYVEQAIYNAIYEELQEERIDGSVRVL